MRAAEILLSLKSRRPGHTLPGEFYTDPAIYQCDLDQVFYKQWLFVGHDCELSRPGDYLTLQVGDYPVLVVRDRAGAIRAFHNSCRHRGSRICSAAKGSSVRLVCPYHNWSYDLDGRLLFARDMAKPFDSQALGLKPLACESAAGYVWICLNPNPPDFEAFRAAMTPYFAPHDLSGAKVAHESTIVENGNWKLVWENNRECYHCSPNHPELCRSFPESPTVAGVHGAADDPVIAAHWARLEAAGLPSGFNISRDGQYRMTRMPLLRDATSYTMTGKDAVARPLSARVTTPAIGSLLTFHYPSLWNHVLGDHAVSFRVLPIGPKQTQVTTRWLVNAEAVEGVDYTVEELTKVWIATNDQDRCIVEENQLGVSSPAFEPGPYNPIHEGGVIQFVDWYAATIERALSGQGERAAVA
ncbi:MAG: aromatic ring-hydroxylating dioxygenase subunit alpha [Pseudomonadota bacterium]|nr:aromatic ring-hydroxylating dioxygenase subunit alpha [Pseudomonadota bacterium]